MKRNRLLIILFLGILFLNNSCRKNWDEPNFQIPQYTGKAPNKTIADLKALHDISSNAPDSVPLRGDFIVQAWVVSSDEGGNFYKSMFVQDATGAIEIPIDKTGLYNDYPVGQKVIINAKGLVVGDYHNMYQMGWIYQGAIGRINSLYINRYISKDGLPDTLNMPQRTLIQSAADLNPDNVGKLVEIRNCEFTDESVGKPLAYNDYITEHPVRFNGNTITLRTSNYAKFRSITCPSEPVTLIGILTVYNTSYQLMLRTREDMIIQGAGPGPGEVIKEMTFDENSLTTGGWRLSDPASPTAWYYQSSGGNQFMFHGPTSAVTDDWLISPEITLDELAGVSLYLEHRMTLQGLQDFFQVYYSVNHVDGQFDENDWVAFNPNLNVFPSEFGLSNALDVSVIPSRTFRIAIRYHNYNGIQAARWFVKNIQFKK